jgi:tetratricopeptide (TPR) repeat protein
MDARSLLLVRTPLGLLIALALAAPSGCSMMSGSQNAEGVRLMQQGQYQAALDRFQRAVVNDPANPDGYYNMAAFYHQMGKSRGNAQELALAENFYRQALDRNPDYRDGRRGLAVLLVEQNRGEEAVRMLEGWVQRSPINSDARVELARVYQELGNKEQAQRHLVDAIGVNPSDSRALAALGRLYEESGNLTAALSNYERALARNQAQPDLAARVASLRSSLGQPQLPTPGTRTVVTPTSPTFR